MSDDEHMHHRPVFFLITRQDKTSYVDQRTTWAAPHFEPRFVEEMRKAQLKEGGTLALISREEYDRVRFSK